MYSMQKGVGLMEVLVALLLLSVAVLGFAGLQVRALTASIDAGKNIQAINLARDLAERIRINRDGFSVFNEKDGYTTEITASKDCLTEFCSASDMAAFDFVQVNYKTQLLGMSLAIHDCQGSTLSRKCIYVAWGETTPSDGADSNSGNNKNCTNGAAYVVGAQCIILEAYNYE